MEVGCLQAQHLYCVQEYFLDGNQSLMLLHPNGETNICYYTK